MHGAVCQSILVKSLTELQGLSKRRTAPPKESSVAKAERHFTAAVQLQRQQSMLSSCHALQVHELDKGKGMQRWSKIDE